MSSESTALPRWVRDFALLRDRTVNREESNQLHSIAGDGSDYEVACRWPAASHLATLLADPDLTSYRGATRITFLGAPDAAVSTELAEKGWQQTESQVLLAGMASDVEQLVSLPETSTLFEAPMDDYDVVEVTDFDAPAARGRIRFSDTFALLADPSILVDSHIEVFRTAIVANLAAAAARQGLPLLFMVADADPTTGTHAERAPGWSNATRLTTFTRA